MPKLPRGIKRRGHAFYLRQFGKHLPGGERWIPLGSDLGEARVRADQIRDAALAAESESLPTVAEFTERWLTEWVGTRRSPANQGMARARMDTHVLPLLGSRFLAEITPADLRRLVASLTRVPDAPRRPLATRTVAHILADVRCCFRYATEEARLLTRSPWVPSLMPVVQEEIPEPLSDVELRRSYEACPTSRKPLFRLALATGLRYGELRALAWTDLVEADEEPYLLIARSHERARTKSAKVRAVPLTADALAALASIPHGSALVFTGRSDGSMGRSTDPVNRVIASKVPGFHFHRLRHTFACRFLAAGGQLAALQRILGHASVTTTERYARLFTPDVLKAMRALPEGWMLPVARTFELAERVLER